MVFTSKMFEKYLWKSNILLKDAGHLHLYLKCHSSTGVFKHFASKKQLPGQSVSGILVENGLKIQKIQAASIFCWHISNVFETFIYGHHKMFSTFMKLHFTRESPKRKYYRAYRKFNTDYFSCELSRQLDLTFCSTKENGRLWRVIRIQSVS